MPRTSEDPTPALVRGPLRRGVAVAAALAVAAVAAPLPVSHADDADGAHAPTPAEAPSEPEPDITDLSWVGGGELAATVDPDADSGQLSVTADPAEDGEPLEDSAELAGDEPVEFTFTGADPTQGYEATATVTSPTGDDVDASDTVDPLVAPVAALDASQATLTGAGTDGLAVDVTFDAPDGVADADLLSYEIAGPDGATTVADDAGTVELVVSAADLPGDVEVAAVAFDGAAASDPTDTTVDDVVTVAPAFVDEVSDRGEIVGMVAPWVGDGADAQWTVAADGDPVADGPVDPGEEVELSGFDGTSVLDVTAFVPGAGEVDQQIDLDTAGTEAQLLDAAGAAAGTMSRVDLAVTDADLAGTITVDGATLTDDDATWVPLQAGPFDADTTVAEADDGPDIEVSATPDSDGVLRWTAHRADPDDDPVTAAILFGTDVMVDGKIVEPFAAAFADAGDHDASVDADTMEVVGLPLAAAYSGDGVDVDALEVTAYADGAPVTQGVYVGGDDTRLGDLGRDATLADWLRLGDHTGEFGGFLSVVFDGVADEIGVAAGGDDTTRIPADIEFFAGGATAASANPVGAATGEAPPAVGKTAPVGIAPLFAAVGAVADAATGVPVAGAEINVTVGMDTTGDGDADETLELSDATSVDGGAFAAALTTTDHLDNGDDEGEGDPVEINVTAAADGYEPYEAASAVSEDDAIFGDGVGLETADAPGEDPEAPTVDALTVELDPADDPAPEPDPSTDLVVTVTGEADGGPVEGAEVTVADDGDEVLTAATGEDGEVAWSTGDGDDVPTGEVEVAAAADGHLPDSRTATVADGETAEVTVTLATVERVAGDDRVATAADVATTAFPDGADTVVVATGDVPADALAAAPLAALLDAPVLLTRSDDDGIGEEVAAAVEVLGADDAVVVGGANAIPAAVEAALADEGLDTGRVAGADRYETAALIADHVADHGGVADEAVLAMSDPADPDRGWPDALAAANLSAARGDAVPVLLTAAGTMPEVTADAADGRDVTVVGGTSVIPDHVADEVDVAARLAGDDRIATARAVLDDTWGDDEVADAWVATADNHPDALAAGAAAAASPGPLVPVSDVVGGQATARWLDDAAPAMVRIVGGTAALSDATVDAVVAPR